MMTEKIDLNDSLFTTGDVVAVKITAIHESGVEVKTMKGNVPGVIKARCFGETHKERKAMMKHYSIGQKVIAKVCAYYSSMQRLVMELASFEEECSFTVITTKKPMKHLLPAGTTILVDSANVLAAAYHAIPEVAPVDVLRSLAEGLKDFGYESIFFMEYRTYGWVIKTYAESAEAFKTFCGEQIGLVHGEADEVLLQTALAMPGTVILSNDNFRDYTEPYSEIVGTARVCKYSVVSGVKSILAIHGVKKLISLQHFGVEQDEKEMLPPEIACIEERYSTPVTPRAVCSQDCLCQLRRKAAERDPEALECLATRYAEGDGVVRNFRKSATLDRCAQEAKKRSWQLERRQKRGVNHFHKCA